MQLLDGRYVYSATDLNNYLECPHLSALERGVAGGTWVRPSVPEPTKELVKKKGDEHERRRLASYVAAFGDGVVRFGERATNTRAGLAAAEGRTVAAMASGALIIYQATFFDGTFVGHADFLRRVERPSARWAWSYEVIDTKLALSPKPYFIIQLCNYSDHLERLQGSAPEHGYVVFGNGTERAFKIAAYAAYYRHLKATFLQAEGTAEATYPSEVGHCSVCAWTAQCEQRRENDDHLSLVAGIRTEQIDKLQDGSVSTMTALAATTQRPERMTGATFVNLQTQAALQVEQRRAVAAGETYPYRYRFREAEPADAAAAVKPRDTVGFAKLPPPATGDLFFDIEGDPLYRADRGLEYLFGFYLPYEDRYVAFWAKDASEERAAFEACVDFIAARLERYPDMHVYHYAAYERSALGRLMGEFASRESEIDRFFTAGSFVDLYAVVRQALWVSQPSYSLKKVEAFYGWERRTETRGGADSIVMFESWLATGDDGILADIERYNEDDCRSTHALLLWLVGVRDAYNAGRAEPIPWRATNAPPPVPVAVERTELERLLLDGLPQPSTLRDLRALPEEVRERWLLGHALQYHRRENKPAYWEYFRRCESVEELAEFDRKAIGGLVRRRDVAPLRRGKERNLIYEFEYPPQEFDLRSGDCPDLRKPISEIVENDELRRVLRLKLSPEMAETLRAIVPGAPLPHGPRQRGIERIASALAAGSLAVQHPATSALLRADVPRLAGRPRGATLQPRTVSGAALADAMGALDGSYLFVQGPPGSGKSTFGAEAIVAMLAAGKRVGLMANGHKALHGLLTKIERAATHAGVTFAGVHKMSASTDDSQYVSSLATPLVRSVDDARATSDGQLVSGTAYFWPDETLTGTFDYVVIDEAGQVSLADALNASMAARNVVLLGDPRQLPQVTQGSHPVGAGASILEHLLGEHDTVPPERGIFLDVSFRMEPAIARFVSATSYEGRLRAAPTTVGNRVASPGMRGGGLAYVPVAHAGNGRSSSEEAARIVAEIGLLLRGDVVRDGRAARPLRQSDIIVVTPYNLQRRKLREQLDTAGFSDVAVGTVDKFQGQEAPVVFYSMATSSDDDLPRDMTFLFDRNRFNVAISRAQCLSVLVCSPRLLDARCRTPEQMLLVNLLCAFVESATPYG
ncbi:MAG: TM0106 family RecB-like putative nuclease [Vulcanimicrobiaceae bacterium]